MSLKKRIKKYLDRTGWVSGKRLEQLTLEFTKHKASYCARECRHLAEDGEIQREERHGTVWYGPLGVEKPKPIKPQIIKINGNYVAKII